MSNDDTIHYARQQDENATENTHHRLVEKSGAMFGNIPAKCNSLRHLADPPSAKRIKSAF